MKTITKLLLVSGLLLTLQGCLFGEDDATVVENPPVPSLPTGTTVTDIAGQNAGFSILLEALEATGLDQTLADSNGTFTVFAPTNAAFLALGQATIDELLADPDRLTEILTYHVLASEVNADAAIAAAGTRVQTVNGADIALSLSGNSLLVNQATVTLPNVEASNGVIHAIDAILMPPAERTETTANIVETAVAAGNFTILADLLTSTGLVDVLSNPDEVFTVFAPTDAAFEALGENILTSLSENPEVLEAILLQHVVVGVSADSITAYSLSGTSLETAGGAEIPLATNPNTDRITFGGASVVMPDVFASNGVIHVINSVVVGEVMVPPAGENLVEIASANEDFETLVAALQATGLDAVLAEEFGDQFTVFAPTDAAFAKLGEDTINALLADTDTLRNILLYHVIAGDSAILQDAALTVAQSGDNIVTMANEQNAALSVSDDTLYVNTSVVSATDVIANNGVIHVVDTVILPPAMRGEPNGSIVDIALADANFSTLVSLLTEAELVDVLADESSTFTVFAPTDAAFAKIPDASVAALTSDANALTKVLLQHVIEGAAVNSVAAFAANGTSVDTAAGEDVDINIVNFALATNDVNSEVAYDAENQRLVGGMGSSNPGFTLYTFDNDLGGSGSVCNGGCAANWPPVLVTDGELGSIPGLSMIERDDGTMQAAYLGRPLYFFVNDTEAGQANGQGAGGVWFQVDQAPVSLQVNGANVDTVDIYATNGVIHVIDTVILETFVNSQE